MTFPSSLSIDAGKSDIFATIGRKCPPSLCWLPCSTSLVMNLHDLPKFVIPRNRDTWPRCMFVERLLATIPSVSLAWSMSTHVLKWSNEKHRINTKVIESHSNGGLFLELFDDLAVWGGAEGEDDGADSISGVVEDDDILSNSCTPCIFAGAFVVFGRESVLLCPLPPVRPFSLSSRCTQGADKGWRWGCLS
mmetsp:Transcript_31281/g.76302  ORF Transcript_31281/g.76302 Transcript_31281/m.76302 type:complete len:192 (+) Transcript_31281:1356-1931(+)